MKIATKDLTGPALDWAVAKCEESPGDTGRMAYRLVTRGHWKPSTGWSQGGPIIEREGIGFEWMLREWKAAQTYAGPPYRDRPDLAPIGERHLQYGPTPLVAAMRCFVASRLGDEVDIPEELTR